ncbi:hypothetical protein [Salinimicrobium sediminilitoris]|uniref:hypothetical protein n=1 Tax=Salinimicrobium sediminilitoris TaxID=2876715 RepID=UPI001E58F070|nr:hypothetical protein [Salinimicrobium sediminilitoris]MCC8360453.1 hypothetical protein [Salinimicrobium sediminilitoris]
MTSIFVSCSDDEFTPPNYVTFEGFVNPNIGVEVDGSATREVTVYTANVTSNDRTFDVMVGDATTLASTAYTVPSTVTVPGGTNEATFEVQVSDVDLGLVGKTLVLRLDPTVDGLYTGDPYVLNVGRVCEGTDFTVDLVFDGYASETTWTLSDADGNILIEVDGYSDGAATATRSLCPGEGTFTFTITDSFGDGLTYPAEGSVTLSYGGEEFAVIPGDFGSEESVNFTIGPDGATVVGGDTDGGDTDGGDTDGGDTDGGDTDGGDTDGGDTDGGDTDGGDTDGGDTDGGDTDGGDA